MMKIERQIRSACEESVRSINLDKRWAEKRPRVTSKEYSTTVVLNSLILIQKKAYICCKDRMILIVSVIRFTLKTKSQ